MLKKGGPKLAQKLGPEMGPIREPKRLAGGEYKTTKINKKGQTGPAQEKS